MSLVHGQADGLVSHVFIQPPGAVSELGSASGGGASQSDRHNETRTAALPVCKGTQGHRLLSHRTLSASPAAGAALRVEGQGHSSPVEAGRGSRGSPPKPRVFAWEWINSTSVSIVQDPPVLFLGPREESIRLSHSDDNGRICLFPLPLNGHHAPYTSCHPGWHSGTLSSAPTPGRSWLAQNSVDSTTKPCPPTPNKHSLLRQSKGNGERG